MEEHSTTVASLETGTIGTAYTVQTGCSTVDGERPTYSMPGMGAGDLYDQRTVPTERQPPSQPLSFINQTSGGHGTPMHVYTIATGGAPLRTKTPSGAVTRVDGETITTSGYVVKGTASTSADAAGVYAANPGTNETITTSGYVVKGTASTSADAAGLYAANPGTETNKKKKKKNKNKTSATINDEGQYIQVAGGQDSEETFGFGTDQDEN